MIRELLAILLLIAPACAWEIQNETVQNMSISELLEFRETSWNAGMCWALGQSAYDLKDQVPYGTYHTALESANRGIGRYNLMLQEHFNATVFNELKMLEYAA